MIFFKLSLLALIPLGVSIGMYLLEKKTKFADIDNKKKQIIYGVIFGLLSILSTELGQLLNIRVNDGAILNSRDASVLIAGLVFGAPAGLISGFMGGIHRYLAVFWGAGAYTQIACSVSTIIAGLVGAALRVFLFDNKKPSVFYAFVTGSVVEVFHMLMVFFTNMDDIEKAFGVVRNATIPMVIINGVTVMLSVMIITMIGKEKIILSGRNSRTISSLFQRWLLITILVAYSLTSTFTMVMQFKISQNNTKETLSVNIEDVKKDVLDASNAKILNNAENVKKYLVSDPTRTLEQATQEFDICEIHIIDKETGIITRSTDAGYMGFDMKTGGEQSKDFWEKIKANEKYVQKYGEISKYKNTYRKYAGIKLDNGDYMQIGYDVDGFQQFVDPLIVSSVANRHIGNTGFLVVVNSLGTVVASGNQQLKDMQLKGDDLRTLQSQKSGVVMEKELGTIEGSPFYIMFEEIESYYIVSTIPIFEANTARDLTIYVFIFMEIIVFGSLFILIYLLIKKFIVNNIKEVNDSLAQITGGNLNVTVNVRSNEEFASLSDDINATVDTLKQYIAEAAARIDRELELAKVIQESTLPSVFPPFPERNDIDIFASMNAAKEVGGDFYDFYLLDDDRLAFLVADVSGKGITGAMFMMKAKTLIKGFAERSGDVAEIITKANNGLCEGNDAEMFVTCFMGILDLENGKIEYANAGHNPPLIRHKDGSFEYFKSRPGFVLGGMEGVNYRKGEINFEPGDTIFLYTDGVTEATDIDNQLYGEERLINILNAVNADTAKGICVSTKADVDAFVGEAPQFDDITMLCIKTTDASDRKEDQVNE